MTARSQGVSRVRLTISVTGRPALVINSAFRLCCFSSSWLRRSDCTRASSVPACSQMPRIVVSAWQPTAINAPNRTAFSAAAEPSLQKSIFISASGSLDLMPAQKRVNDQSRAQQWQWGERQPDGDAVEFLSQGRADLGAD